MHSVTQMTSALLTSSEKFKGSNPTSPASSPVSMAGRGVNGSAMDASGSAAIDSCAQATRTKQSKGMARACHRPALLERTSTCAS